MILVQIVTGLPPFVDGIGDYALQLARQLRERHGVTTSFLVGDPTWNGGAIEGFAATKLKTRSLEGFFEGIEAALAGRGEEDFKVLLHYSPYGYATRGCPLWLADAVEKWDERHPGKLNGVFHELKVTGAMPWSSGFWVAPFQQLISLRVAARCNFRYTNTEVHRGNLEGWGAGRIALLLNCSTMIEPTSNPPFAERRKDVILFGRAGHRRMTYNRGSEALAALCASIGAERIIDIGAPMPGEHAKEVGGTPIVYCGRLESSEVSEWMSRSIASFTYYPIPFLGKSTIFSVSCAHGTIPFIFDDQPKAKSCPGLTAGEDFIPLPVARSDGPLPSLETLSQTVFDRYQERASWALGDQVAKALQN